MIELNNNVCDYKCFGINCLTNPLSKYIMQIHINSSEKRFWKIQYNTQKQLEVVTQYLYSNGNKPR